jgi:hypothetical protein
MIDSPVGWGNAEDSGSFLAERAPFALGDRFGRSDVRRRPTHGERVFGEWAELGLDAVIPEPLPWADTYEYTFHPSPAVDRERGR